MRIDNPTIVTVSGFSSNVGKTTLVCELLQVLPGWEAIKVSRGHYRSCGRDPESCCVGNLLQEQPIVRSGRDANYEAGKDTGRYWDAGASNVHWLIVSDEQVEAGIKEALSRVTAGGVIIEGNSFLEYIDPHVAVMCARAEGGSVKSSARKTLSKCDALFLSSLGNGHHDCGEQFLNWQSTLPVKFDLSQMPVFSEREFPQLVAMITGAHLRR